MRNVNREVGTNAVQTHSVCKRYREEVAIDRMNLVVPEGSVYVLIGANGAGKSTTLRLLMNLERPDAGKVELFGLDVAENAPLVRAQVGYVPERSSPGYRWMRCASLLQHTARYYPSWDQAYADHLTSALTLKLHRRVGELSKGEGRRLQLVMALAHRPPLLLLDEPTDGLDPIVRRRVLAILAQHLADTPTTVLLSTHQIYEVETLADHVGVLSEGRLVAQMPRDELQRTVRRYRLEVPEGWEVPPGLRITNPRTSHAGREAQWTVVGEEWEVRDRLVLAGAQVREVTSLALEDAALAFLPEQNSQ